MLQPSCMQNSVKRPWIFWRCSTTMANSGWHIFLPWKWFLFIYLLGGFKSLRSRVSFRQVHAKAGKQQTVPAWLSQRDKIFKIVFPLLLRPEPVVSSEVPVRQPIQMSPQRVLYVKRYAKERGISSGKCDWMERCSLGQSLTKAQQPTSGICQSLFPCHEALCLYCLHQLELIMSLLGTSKHHASLQKGS